MSQTKKKAFRSSDPQETTDKDPPPTMHHDPRVKQNSKVQFHPPPNHTFACGEARPAGTVTPGVLTPHAGGTHRLVMMPSRCVSMPRSVSVASHRPHGRGRRSGPTRPPRPAAPPHAPSTPDSRARDPPRLPQRVTANHVQSVTSRNDIYDSTTPVAGVNHSPHSPTFLIWRLSNTANKRPVVVFLLYFFNNNRSFLAVLESR